MFLGLATVAPWMEESIEGKVIILAVIAPAMAAPAAVFGGLFYPLNLPFVELALRSPFYGERFDRMFHVDRTAPADAAPLAAGQGAIPPEAGA